MKTWELKIKITDDGETDTGELEYFEEVQIKNMINNSPVEAGINIEILEIKEL